MAKKVVLPYQNFKRMIGAGTAKLTNFLVAQRIGKVEFTSKPWSLDKSGGDRITKWVVDLENGKFLKLVNGEVDYQEKRTVGEAIGEISDLIDNEKVNDYSSVTLYRRTSIPGKTSGKFSNESRKNMKPRNIGLMQIVETIVRREMATKRKRRKLTEASLEKDPVKAYIQAALWSSHGDEESGIENLDDQYGYDDVAPKAVASAKADLKSFIQKLKQAKLYDVYMKDYDLSQLAYDFWMTRNGHGVGFWDRDYSNDAPDGSDLGKAISKIVDSFREVNAVVGDDGKIYFE